MTNRLRWPIALATAGGMAAGIWTLGVVGLAALVEAAARLGAGGFAALCAMSLLLMVVLGAAWLAVLPAAGGDRLGLFAWARTAREASSDILPFAQLGGLVVGSRTLTAAGLPAVPVYASMIVDLTTEMGSQAVVTLFGVVVLAGRLAAGNAAMAGGVWIGAAIGIGTLASFAALQRPLLSLGAAMLAKLAPDADLPLAPLRAELDALYARRGRIALSLLLNLAGWLLSAGIGWATLAMMGTAVPFGRMLALESLIFAVRTAAFAIPGAIGVQEAAYLLLAGLFGIDPHAAVARSLVKRARDVAIGVPALILWQAREWRMRPA
jgi:putative membrane protein